MTQETDRLKFHQTKERCLSWLRIRLRLRDKQGMWENKDDAFGDAVLSCSEELRLDSSCSIQMEALMSAIWELWHPDDGVSVECRSALADCLASPVWGAHMDATASAYEWIKRRHGKEEADRFEYEMSVTSRELLDAYGAELNRIARELDKDVQ